jgi:UDPglucose--hexose-1-phosphate uridylyltransferase
VRVVPNRFPALARSAPAIRHIHPPVEKVCAAVGAHEVVIDAPDHDVTLTGLSRSRLAAVLGVYRERVRALAVLPGVKAIALFRNDGRGAGASQTHPHSQILALPVVPTAIRSEVTRAQALVGTEGRCPTCRSIASEDGRNRRVVQNATFEAFTAFAARYAYETWIVPRDHGHDFRDCEDLVGLAGILQQVLHGLESVLGRFPFNLVLQTAPIEKQHGLEEAFHWRLEVVPRMTVPSGLELGCGVFIVAVPPEQAAARLRDAIATDEDVLAAASPADDDTPRSSAG